MALYLNIFIIFSHTRLRIQLFLALCKEICYDFDMNSLPKRLAHCILNGELLERGMEYYSFLDAHGNRKDYCSQCWIIAKKEEGHFWKGKVPFKKEKKGKPDEKTLEIFKQESDPKKKFILAIYLQRKHQLIRRTQTIYEEPENGELFDVAHCSLSTEEGAALVQELTRHIEVL
jgi:hypothetical protein